MEPEKYDAALRAARERVTDVARRKPAAGEYTLAMNALVTLAKAVGAASGPCIGAHPYNAGYLRCAEYIAAQVSEEDQARARRGRCFSCEARAEADRLAAPYLEVKA